jgi:hypothetical protein
MQHVASEITDFTDYTDRRSRIDLAPPSRRYNVDREVVVCWPEPTTAESPPKTGGNHGGERPPGPNQDWLTGWTNDASEFVSVLEEIANWLETEPVIRFPSSGQDLARSMPSTGRRSSQGMRSEIGAKGRDA